MRLKIEVEELATEEVEEVLVGMVIARKWERETGRKIAELDEDPTVLVELARIGYNRKHGRSLTEDEFEDRFELGEIDSGGRPVPDPSGPATAPQ